MGRVKFRKVKEIYATSVEVVQPKNTESEGNDGAGGHADAAEQAVESNEGLSVIGEQQNPSEEIHSRQKSGACDVCTSSCSCMLSERHASAAEGTKAHEASMVDNSPHGNPVKAIKELSHEVAVLSKRSDTSVVSSLKDPYIGANSSKGLRSKFSDEQVESSLDGEVRNVQNWADSVKAEFEINGEVAAECSYQKEHLRKLDGDGVTIMQPTNRCDGTNKVEDVKTCDICGDVGWDDCLATCSRCSNGAEHIYCMRLKLDKVPEGNWLCEECTLADENEKKRRDQSSKNHVEGSSSYQQREDSGTSDSVKRTMDSSKTLPIKKRRSLKKVGELSILSKPCFKAAENCSLASWNLDEKKTDSTSQGSLCKSKSLNDIKSGVESNQQGSGAEKQCVDKETVICDDEKEGPAHSESLIKNSMSGDGKVVDSQVNEPCSEFPRAENSNCTSLAKILSLAADNNWHRNLVRPPVIQNGASMSQRSGQTPVQGETVFAVPLGSKNHDIMDVQGDGKSSEPSNSNSETVMCDDEKEGPAHSESSIKISMSGDGKVVDPQVNKPCSEFPQAENSNSTSLAKILSLAADNNWHRNLVRPPVIQNGASTSQRSGQTPVQGETVFAVPPGSKHHDIMDVQGVGKSSKPSNTNSETVFSVPPRSKHHDIMSVQGDGKSSEPSKSNSETIFPVPPRSNHHEIMAVQGDGKSSQSSKSNSAMKFVEKMTTAFVTKPNNLIAPSSSSGVPPRPESMSGITSAANNSSCFPISPQFNCVWQGGFEVLGKGAIPKPCDGIQAHLSTCSAPKVSEVERRLPQKILVVQVPLKAVRPSQFEQCLAIEDNIALYFFARDVESYETNYKNLLDQMIMCDLALKGNVDGVELLIFTSNLLPEKFQRWNGLLFLWGVFRAMKSSNSQDLPSPLSISSNSGVYADPSGSLPSPQSSGMLSTSNTLYNIAPKAPDSCISSEKPCLTSAELGKTSDNEISSPQSKLSGLQNADEQLSAVGSLSKTVQASGDLHPRDILRRETKGGKRRAEIETDLLASRETNDKRWKSYLEMLQYNRRPIFSSEFKHLDSGSGKDLRLGRALTIGRVFPPPKAVSMKDKNVLEPEILNLELSLGTGKKKVAQEISSPSLGLVDDNKGNGDDECLTSLTLSLALPVSDEQNKDECSISTTTNESDECLTSLTLSLTLPASNEQNKGWNHNRP